MARDAGKPFGHVVHIERLPEHGVRIWLDGVQLQQVSGWSLIEELRPPSTLMLTIKTDTIVWGAPPPAVVEGSPLELSEEAHRYLLMLDAVRRLAHELDPQVGRRILAIVNATPPAAPAPILDDGQRHFAAARRGGGRVTPSGKVACETCGEAWTCSTYIRRGEFPPELD